MRESIAPRVSGRLIEMSLADLPFKVGHMVGGEIMAFRHEKGFSPMDSPSGTRLAVGSPDPMSLLSKLLSHLEPPYRVTVVLHTPRGDEEAGRYHAVLEADEVNDLIARFRGLLERDARLDFCVESPSGLGVTYDKHDLLLLGGHPETWLAWLEREGFRQRTIELPFPHTHHYRQEFDLDVKALLEAHDWEVSPLLPGDGD